MEKLNIYQEVTNKIKFLLKSHIESKFTNDWFDVENELIAYNVESKRVYSLVNQIILSKQAQKREYYLNRWLTFLQITKLGGTVIKGSKASFVAFSDCLYIDKQTGMNVTKQAKELIKQNPQKENEFEKRWYLKRYNVFNLAQCEDLPGKFYAYEMPKQLTKSELYLSVKNIIDATGVKVHETAVNKASYSHSSQVITIPYFDNFVTNESYCNTVFHELGHWTGSEERLNREKAKKFGDEKYAFEELVAELCSAYCCAKLGIKSTITNNVAYIENWLNALNKDNKFFINAANEAQKACEYIFSFSQQLQVA